MTLSGVDGEGSSPQPSQDGRVFETRPPFKQGQWSLALVRPTCFELSRSTKRVNEKHDSKHSTPFPVDMDGFETIRS